MSVRGVTLPVFVSRSAGPTRSAATCPVTVTIVPDTLTSTLSTRLSSFMLAGQLSMSSPKSEYVGVAVNLTPPLVAPRMLARFSVAVAGSKSRSRTPALSCMFLKTVSGSCVNFIPLPP